MARIFGDGPRLGGHQVWARYWVLVVALGLAVACKPATEEEKYQRALAWTSVEDVRLHLDGGKDASQRFPSGDSPIHVTTGSIRGSAEIVRLLIERGADVEAKDSDGKTGWDLVWGDGKRKLTKSQAAMLLALIDGGFSPPVLELPNGRRLLHAVAQRVPSARLVQVLVKDHGRAVDAVDEDGWTPLHVAIRKNNAQAATGLLAQEADPNAETSHGVGPRSNRTGAGVRRWRYPAGSRPLDLYSTARGRHDVDVRDVVRQYGGTKNPALKNKPH